MALSKKIDDRDSSIAYSRYGMGLDWEPHVGVQQEYMGTTTLARAKGVNATISFSGISIGVYGTVSEAARGILSTPTSEYILNENLPVYFTPISHQDTQYSVLFYQSMDLDDGEHTLQIINQSQDGFFWLDYFIVGTQKPFTGSPEAPNDSEPIASPSQNSQQGPNDQGFKPTSSTVTLATPSNSTPVPVSRQSKKTEESSAGLSLGSTPTTSPQQPSTSIQIINNSSQPPNSKTSVIVGGALGGILGIMIAFILVFWVRKKRADKFARAASAIMSNPALTPSTTGYLRPKWKRGVRTITPFGSFPTQRLPTMFQDGGFAEGFGSLGASSSEVNGKNNSKKGQRIEGQYGNGSTGLAPEFQARRDFFVPAEQQGHVFNNMDSPPPYPGDSGMGEQLGGL